MGTAQERSAEVERWNGAHVDRRGTRGFMGEKQVADAVELMADGKRHNSWRRAAALAVCDINIILLNVRKQKTPEYLQAPIHSIQTHSLLSVSPNRQVGSSSTSFKDSISFSTHQPSKITSSNVNCFDSQLHVTAIQHLLATSAVIKLSTYMYMYTISTRIILLEACNIRAEGPSRSPRNTARQRRGLFHKHIHRFKIDEISKHSNYM